ncbi:MAG TPA: hypothetical protein VF553_18860 [Pyrinomonadaceae bacterium]|jgi:hypothetical protein
MKSPARLIFSPILLLTLAMCCLASLDGPTRSARASAPVQAHAYCDLQAGHFSTAAITWSPVEVECPVCKTKNIFLAWGSYGSYIYQFPSKYQLVFWPYTDSAAWYSCKTCRLTTFMEDFKQIPAEKIPELRQMLQGVSLPQQKTRSPKQSMDQPPYLELPMDARLGVAEKVYRTLGRTDDEFWNHFYRVMGYHFDAGKQAEADEVRRKSLAITERALADKANEGHRKELLYISGAMHHFLRDDALALKDFEQAKSLKYSDKNLSAEDNEGYNGYLSKLIDEYIEMLRRGAGPRTKPESGSH